MKRIFLLILILGLIISNVPEVASQNEADLPEMTQATEEPTTEESATEVTPTTEEPTKEESTKEESATEEPAAEGAEEPIVCNGDKVEYFKEENKVVGTGNVVITYKDAVLTCDRVTVWTKTKDAEAEGNAIITRGETIVWGEKIIYNFEEQTGKIIKAKVESPPWYAVGKEAEKVSGKKYIIRKGYMTTCDHEFPHWKLSADRMEIKPDVIATTYNAFFWVNPLSARGYIPLMWVPYYCHPLDDDRPHVTVIPGKSTEWGYYLLTAWRYHLTPDQKGYFHFDYRERKDVAVGMDYIYDSHIFGKGNITTYYMHERDVKLRHNYHRLTKKKWRDVASHEKDYAWYPSTEEEKGLLRIRHQWQMRPETLLTAEMHKYKNESLLKDYFFNEYEKDVRPESYVLVTDTTGFLNSSLLTRKRVNRFDSTTEVLPEAKFNINSLRLLKSDFYYSGELSAVHFNKVFPRYTDDSPGEITDPQHNNRYDSYNKLTYQTKLLRFLNVSPYAGIRQTYFDRSLDSDDSQIRGTFDSGVDVSTKFFKVFRTKASPFGMEINDLRHIITPTIGYSHTPKPTMPSSKVAQFDGIDGIGRANAMGLGLENKLQTKRGADLNSVDLAMLLVNTSYDFSHTPGGQLSDYTAKLELRPFDWLVATSDAIMDPHKRYHHQWLRQLNNHMSITIPEKWSFGIGHTYIPGSNSMRLFGSLDMIPGWRLSAYEDIDILGTHRGEKERIHIREQEYRIIKDLHCWELDVRYNVTRSEGEEIMFIFRLKAFPNIPFQYGKEYHKPKAGSQSY